MKLSPRERKPRVDYLLENAAALRLGNLYLGWNKKRKRKNSLSHTKIVKSTNKNAKTKSSQIKKKNVVLPVPVPTPPLPEEGKNDRIQLSVCFVNGETVCVIVKLSTTVSELKTQICRICPLHSESNPILYSNGVILAPQEAQLFELGVTTGAIIHCFSN